LSLFLSEGWPIGMHDKLIHDYLGVDIEVVWRTIELDLPLLKEMLKSIDI
jgi:uncharacterized protein with HEPN domain